MHLTELQEAALRLLDSYDGRRSAVQRALFVKYRESRGYAYVVQMWDDKIVYNYTEGSYGSAEYKDVRYEAAYEIKEGAVTLGEPALCELAYIPASECQEAFETAGENVPFQEAAALDATGRGYVKIIAPGFGATRVDGLPVYYSEDTLRRDGPKVFKSGLHMYWNHQTPEERKKRPEGDLRDLAAVLKSDAVWKENGPAGKGLYAEIQTTTRYRQDIQDLAPHIGVSIRAGGSGMKGQVAGKPAMIATSFSAARSVDFVTKAGAGGKVLEMFEAAGSREDVEIEENNVADNKMVSIDETELKQLRESAAKAEKLSARLDAIEAQRKLDVAQGKLKVHVEESLKAAKIGEKAVPQLSKYVMLQVAESGLNEDLTINEAAVKAVVDAEVAEHKQFIESVMPKGVKGLGDGDTATERKAVNVEEARKVADKSIGAIFTGAARKS